MSDLPRVVLPADLHRVRNVHDILGSLPGNAPVFIRVPVNARPGEYVPISTIEVGDLANQNADGDPQFHGHAEVVVLG